MSGAAADRNLLLGIIALQMDFISRDALIAAMHSWVLNKATSLSQILQHEGALSASRRALLDALVEEHIKLHDKDPQKSLGALSSIGSLRAELSLIADRDLRASLPHVSAARQDLPDDPDRTATPTIVGDSTSAGTRFHIIRPHARGGLGQVFVARDTELNRDVALKEIQMQFAFDPRHRSRFEFEAEVTGGLEHPGIVPVYGLGHMADGRPFYAMRFIKGNSLKDAIRQFHTAEQQPGRAPGQSTLELRALLGRFIDVCDAVAYAHSRGVLHRDLKPGNIMLGKYGETLVVDWGLAKALDRPEPESAAERSELPLKPASGSALEPTLAGTQVGTPAYMSPEQAAGRLDQLGPRSDVYCLGATLYHLLTGHAPCEGEEVGELYQKILAGDIPRPRTLNPRIAPPLEAVCVKAMASNPEDRYASVVALQADLERWLADEPVTACDEPFRVRARRWMRRHQTLVTAAAVLVVTTVAGLGAGIVLLGRKQAEIVQERNTAQKQREVARHEEAGARLITRFYEDHLLAAARPEAIEGGVGKNVTLLQALDKAVTKIDETFAGQPELEAAVRNAVGVTYGYLAKEDLAKFNQDRAYAIRQAVLGPNHPDTLTTAYNISGRDDAEPLCREVLPRMQRVLGPEHETTLSTQINFAFHLRVRGNFDEAEPLLRETLASCKRALGPERRPTLFAQKELAVVLASTGRREEALALQQETLASQRRVFPPNHRDTLISIGSVAAMLERLGRWEEAEKLYREEIAGERRVYGPDFAVFTEASLGNLWRKRGKLAEAELLLRRSLEGARREYGDKATATSRIQGYIAFLLEDQGKPGEAEQLLRAHYDGCLRDNGPLHPHTRIAQQHLGLNLKKQGKLADAEALFRSCLEADLHSDGPESDWTLVASQELARVLDERKQVEEAESLYRLTLAVRRKRFASEPVAIADALGDLGTLLATTGHAAEAEPLLRECLAIRDQKLPPIHWQVPYTRSLLGVSVASQGRFAEAEPFLLSGYEGLTKAEGTPAKRVAEALDRIVELYDKWGKADQAEVWRKKRPASVN